MTREPSIEAKPATGAAPPPPPDLTGRKQMVANVLASWVGQFVFIVAGFILPRMIDRRLGQELLGAWDFSWSVVAYFSLITGGVVSAVNRYVAMHRVKDDHDGVNRVASSVCCVLAVMASLIVLSSVGAAYVLGRVEGLAISEHLDEVRWVVMLLGFEIAVQTLFSGFGGVITGCHRWGIHNTITTVSYAVAVAGMISALYLGASLRTLAAIHFSCGLAAWLTRFFMAYRICPTLSVRWRHVRIETARSMLKFGAKTLMPYIADLILNQTTSLLIAIFLGPATLAFYARSGSLIKSTRQLVAKMSSVLVPSVSSLQATGDPKAIQLLVLKSTRYSAFLTLPMTMVLVTSGGPVLNLWMGANYNSGWVVGFLTVGYTLSTIQIPIQGILAGLNQHGRLATANLLINIGGALGVAGLLGWTNASVAAVAAVATTPAVLLNVFFTPAHICRHVGLSIWQYARESFLLPLLLVSPLGLSLLAARWIFTDRPTVGLLAGGAVGGLILVPIYWHHVLPAKIKETVRRRLFRHRPLSAAGAVSVP